MSELVIRYNEKFVKDIYWGDLVYQFMSIRTRRITASSFKWNPVLSRFIYLNRKNGHGNVTAFDDMETYFYQGATVMFFHQEDKRRIKS